MNLKEQLQELTSTTPMTPAALSKIKVLCSDPTKDKQAIADSKAISSLKKQVASLKAQLAPMQDPVNAETMLDELYALQQKRSSEILETGLDFTIGSSERTCKALIAGPDQMYFTPGTPLSIGLEIRSTTGNLSIVDSFKAVAGRIEATVWTPRHNCQRYEKTATASGGFNLKSVSRLIPCSLDGDTITTFRERLPAGTLLKLLDAFYTVAGSYTDNNLVSHKIQPYAEQKATPVQINRSVRDTEPLQPGHSLYWSRTL